MCAPAKLQDGTSVGGDTGPKFGALLGHGSRNGGSLHFALVVDNHSGRVLKVDKDTFLPAKGFALSDDNSRQDFFAEFGLALFDRAHDHVAGTGFRVTIEASSNVANANDVEILGSRIVGAVHNSGRGETCRDTVLDARSGGASSLSFSFAHGMILSVVFEQR